MSRNIEDWGDSRWEFTKNQSQWHFDASIESIDYQPVCTFAGDWTKEVEDCLKVG